MAALEFGSDGEVDAAAGVTGSGGRFAADLLLPDNFWGPAPDDSTPLDLTRDDVWGGDCSEVLLPLAPDRGRGWRQVDPATWDWDGVVGSR